MTAEIIDDAPQADGRRYITEKHTDRMGHEHRFVYMLAADGDANAIMQQRAAQLADQLLNQSEDQEIENGLYAG